MKIFLNLTTAILVLLISFLFLSFGSASRESLTYDEIVHIEEGMNAWKKKEFRIDTNNPPLIRELAVIPLLFQHSDSAGNTPPNQAALPARAVIIFLSLLLGIVIYRVADSLFGVYSAVFAIALYAFDPNILANNHYVTQDLGSALFFFLGYVSLVYMIQKPSWKSFIWHGVWMGCLAATKITLIPYYAVSALFVVPYLLPLFNSVR